MRKKIDLSNVSKEAKIAFLEKLQTGFYKLKISKEHEQRSKRLTFDRLESGLYKCNETAAHWSRNEIEEMEEQYLLLIELIDKRDQPPSGFELIPYSPELYLNTLLINTKNLTK